MRRSYSIFTICLVLTVLLLSLPARPAGAARLLLSPSPTEGIIMPVVTVTPQTDGSLVHEVQPGQSLWQIAMAYGVKIADMVRWNSELSPVNPVIYVGQKIIVRGTLPPSSTPTVTETPFPVTGTPTITKTPRPPTRTSRASHTPSPTVQAAASLPDLPAFESAHRRTLGIGLVAVCLLGLVVVVIGGFRKK